MKFSAMTTREQAQMLCKIAPAVARIGKDEELNAQLAEMAKENAEGGSKTLLFKLSAMVDVFAPMLLDKHYDDAMAIASCLLGKTAEDMEEMGVISIMREIKGVIDEELISFFKQSAATEPKP